MSNNQVSAVSIKRLWYDDPITSAPTAKALMANPKKVENVHQDTWTLEESEPSQDSYKNQLTGQVYRMGRKEMGEVTANFTIGRYDYELKAAFLGGKVIYDETDTTKAIGWSRSRGVVEIRKTIYALTDDDQLCILANCNMVAYEGNADGAIGIVIKATALEPKTNTVDPEYWFDVSEGYTVADSGITVKTKEELPQG